MKINDRYSFLPLFVHTLSGKNFKLYIFSENSKLYRHLLSIYFLNKTYQM